MPKETIKESERKGFTIIEVVLVLAIAGLIFLMVFVALPALQRSQRDTARRNDMSRVDTSLVQYQTNHSNNSKSNLPGVTSASAWTGNKGEINCNSSTGKEACMFVRDYMNTGSGEVKDNEFLDPQGEAYSLAIAKYISGTSISSFSALSGANWTSKLAYDAAKEGLTIQDNNSGNAFDQHAVYIVPGARCKDDVAIVSSSNHFAVLYRLEGAGVYCIDDQ